MLIYLDANIVQYIADYEAFIFGTTPVPNNLKSGQFGEELQALRVLIEFALEIETLEVANRWEVAAPVHLMKELQSGKPTDNQRDAYSLLKRAWADSNLHDRVKVSEAEITSIERSLDALNLKHCADRKHLAEAITLQASWFLTCDKDILCKTRVYPKDIGVVEGVRVARPSECFQVLSANPALGWSEHRW